MSRAKYADAKHKAERERLNSPIMRGRRWLHRAGLTKRQADSVLHVLMPEYYRKPSRGKRMGTIT